MRHEGHDRVKQDCVFAQRGKHEGRNTIVVL